MIKRCTEHHCSTIGKILHSHSYKKPNGLEDKNVVIVGFGNSAGDAAVELSSVAKKVRNFYRF